jgi:hypothetical protein
LKYYARVTATSGEIVCIYRYDLDYSNYVQEIWMPSKNTWEKTDRLAEHLTYGEPTIEQISESEAKKAFPEAF